MMSSRNRWHVVLAVASLLIIGAAAGITIDRLLHGRPSAHRVMFSAAIHSDPIGVLDRELDLRPEQRERVAAIIAARQGAVNQVWQETHTKLKATIDTVAAEVAAVLDEEQAARFRVLVEEMHAADRGERRP